MSKRSAATNLTRDNWDSEDIAEEIGVFQKASSDELKSRKIKRGKRRDYSTQDDSGPSIFKNFTAFGSNNSNSLVPSFSFVPSNSSVTGSGTTKTTSSSTFFPTFNFGNKIENGNSSPNTQQEVEPKKSTDVGQSPSMPMFKYVAGSTDPKPKTSGSPIKSTEKGSISSSGLFKFGSGSTNEASNAESDNKFGFGFKKQESGSMNNIFNVHKISEPTRTQATNQFQFGKEESNDLRRKFSEPSDELKLMKEKGAALFNSSSEKDEKFLNDVKSLNLSVLEWIKQHLEKNPYIDFTPVFEDYKTHLKNINKKNESLLKSCTSLSKDNSVASTNVPLFGDSTTASTCDKKRTGLALDNVTVQATSDSHSVGILSSGKSATIKEGFSFETSCDKPVFNFGFNDSQTSSGGFAFGSSKNENTKSGFNFTFNSGSSEFNGMTKPSGDTSLYNTSDKDEADEPPKVEVNEVKEEGAIFEQKVKLFYKKDKNYIDRGIGTLYLKPVGEKTQLLVRALTNLGNILLNIILNDSVPTQRVGKNNVLIVCVPNPPIDDKNPNTPVSMLIRVKTSEDADKLLEKIESHKSK